MKYSRNPIKVSKSTGVAQFYYMLTTYCEGFFARNLDSILFATQLSGVPKGSKWGHDQSLYLINNNSTIPINYYYLSPLNEFSTTLLRTLEK